MLVKLQTSRRLVSSSTLEYDEKCDERYLFASRGHVTRTQLSSLRSEPCSACSTIYFIFLCTKHNYLHHITLQLKTNLLKCSVFQTSESEDLDLEVSDFEVPDYDLEECNFDVPDVDFNVSDI